MCPLILTAPAHPIRWKAPGLKLNFMARGTPKFGNHFMIALGWNSTARWICHSLTNIGAGTCISTQAFSITVTRMNSANGFTLRLRYSRQSQSRDRVSGIKPMVGSGCIAACDPRAWRWARCIAQRFSGWHTHLSLSPNAPTVRARKRSGG